MSLVLNIDTSMDNTSLCLAREGVSIALSVHQAKDDGAWLHLEIRRILQENDIEAIQLDAIGVSIGPGSYTGLRVGLASAKGLCYALKKPLITVSTLQMIAVAIKEEAVDLICPLIDARRMEVFMALYDVSLREKISPQAMIIHENSFSSVLTSNKVLFGGNGINKIRPIIQHPNAFFSESKSDASHLATLTHPAFQQNRFADLAYTEPLYVKEFYSPQHK